MALPNDVLRLKFINLEIALEKARILGFSYYLSICLQDWKYKKMDNFNDNGDYDNDDNVARSSQQPNHPYENPYLMEAVVTRTIYAENYLNKQPCRIFSLIGHQWMLELQHGNTTKIYENFRMDKDRLTMNYKVGKKLRFNNKLLFFYILLINMQTIEMLKKDFNYRVKLFQNTFTLF
ncbi:hypothetical protein ACSBR1_027796 [Camellia fascicularis]